jgi:hypothetical protein
MENNSLELYESSELNRVKITKNITSLKLWFTPEPALVASLPKNVKELYIYRGGKDVVLEFPSHLTHLMLPPEYNATLNDLPNIKVLIVGYCYTKELNLPETLEELYFNSYFSSSNGGISLECFGKFPLLKTIPNSLRILQIPIKLNLITDLIEPNLSIFDFEMLGEKIIDNNIEILKIINFHDLNQRTINKIDVIYKLVVNKKVKLEQYECKYDFLHKD